MTTWRDLPDEMRMLRLDDHTADRVLAGAVPPDDAPPGYAEAARVTRALVAPATADEFRLQARTVGGMRAVIAEQQAGPAPIRRRRHMRRFMPLKVGSVVVAGTLVLGTGMAMAGALPAGAQSVAATVLSKVGITVPNPNADSHAPTHPDNHGAVVSDTAHTTTSTGAAKGAEIAAVASDGRSQAGHDSSTSSSSEGKGSTISQIATTTAATGVDKGAEISTEASGGKSQAGQHGSASSTHGSQGSTHSQAGQHDSQGSTHGQAGQHGAAGSDGESGSSGDHPPPVTTPSNGGTGTAGQASGGTSDQGTTTAGDHSSGHSSAGSGNAGSHKP